MAGASMVGSADDTVSGASTLQHTTTASTMDEADADPRRSYHESVCKAMIGMLLMSLVDAIEHRRDVRADARRRRRAVRADARRSAGC